MRQCKRCRVSKADIEFTKDNKGILKTTCKECRAAAAKKKYAARKRKNLCPLCGERPSMVSSCMCEGCWFIRNGPRTAWINQSKECPYTGTLLVPGHNMKFSEGVWISKQYAGASKGMTRERFVEWLDATHDRREVVVEPFVVAKVPSWKERFLKNETPRA